MMIPLSEWLPPASVGLTFTTLGSLKVYGLSRCIVGGGDKPASQRICGTCPSWSRSVNLAAIGLLLAIGLGNLAWLGWIVYSRV